MQSSHFNSAHTPTVSRLQKVKSQEDDLRKKVGF